MKVLSPLKPTLWLLSALVLGGCATTGDLSLEERLAKKGFALGEPVEQVKNYRIDGWNYVDDQHVIFHAGPSRDYLVSTRMRCSDLRGGENIGFSSTNNNLTDLDKLVVETPTGPRDCPIDTIYRLQSKK